MVDLNTYILLFFACIASGAASLLIFLTRGKAIEADLIKEKQLNENNCQKISELQADLQAKDTKLDELRADITEEKTKLASLASEAAEKESGFQKQLSQFEEQKGLLKQEFENLSNKIFEDKGKAFTTQNQTAIDALLTPLKEKLDGFQKRVNEVHDSSVTTNATLKTAIQNVLETGLAMQSEANNLASALKGDSQKRGAWGEAQLERTLQISGLEKGVHYTKQESFRDSEGNMKRTDYVIRLPDEKHIVIDSKVNLNDYKDAVSASSEEEASVALGRHMNGVRSHIDDLVDKDYTDLVGLNCPNFVLMFMPIEPAYIEVIKHGDDLFGYGYEKNVVMVSHTTLIPILRTVSNLWILYQSNQEAKELGDKAQDVYNQVCAVAERTNKLGGSLNAVGNHYTDLVTALAGQQGLFGKVGKFSELSSRANRELVEPQEINAVAEDQRLTVISEQKNTE